MKYFLQTCALFLSFGALATPSDCHVTESLAGKEVVQYYVQLKPTSANNYYFQQALKTVERYEMRIYWLPQNWLGNSLPASYQITIKSKDGQNGSLTESNQTRAYLKSFFGEGRSVKTVAIECKS